jgi:hypothetical protein
MRSYNHVLNNLLAQIHAIVSYCSERVGKRRKEVEKVNARLNLVPFISRLIDILFSTHTRRGSPTKIRSFLLFHAA